MRYAAPTGADAIYMVSGGQLQRAIQSVDLLGAQKW